MPQGRCGRRREKGCRDAYKLFRCVSKRQMACDHQLRWRGSLRRGGRSEMDISESGNVSIWRQYGRVSGSFYFCLRLVTLNPE